MISQFQIFMLPPFQPEEVITICIFFSVTLIDLLAMLCIFKIEEISMYRKVGSKVHRCFYP